MTPFLPKESLSAERQKDQIITESLSAEFLPKIFGRKAAERTFGRPLSPVVVVPGFAGFLARATMIIPHAPTMRFQAFQFAVEVLVLALYPLLRDKF